MKSTKFYVLGVLMLGSGCSDKKHKAQGPQSNSVSRPQTALEDYEVRDVSAELESCPRIQEPCVRVERQVFSRSEATVLGAWEIFYKKSDEINREQHLKRLPRIEFSPLDYRILVEKHSGSRDGIYVLERAADGKLQEHRFWKRNPDVNGGDFPFRARRASWLSVGRTLYLIVISEKARLSLTYNPADYLYELYSAQDFTQAYTSFSGLHFQTFDLISKQDGNLGGELGRSLDPADPTKRISGRGFLRDQIEGAVIGALKGIQAPTASLDQPIQLLLNLSEDRIVQGQLTTVKETHLCNGLLNLLVDLNLPFVALTADPSQFQCKLLGAL